MQFICVSFQLYSLILCSGKKLPKLLKQDWPRAAVGIVMFTVAVYIKILYSNYILNLRSFWPSRKPESS